ncbi:hypothetical protein QYE76_052370 [Lolium multiflorum]|uniref:DUF4218 domain-containing protein n=1 Tax=Lolium multiflorum TaxID=4521 RepID=A0AAD8WJF8_LOLMU|nr:hypothetical protein QYE76_052370 [Lolium multiflorum]
MKQKRKIEEIPDCYHQSMGWGNLHYPLVENIAERADILSTGRLARGMIGMRHAIRGAHKVPFGLPSLLHCDPETWPDDRDNTGIHALLMPLDKPTVPAFIHTKEELDGHGPMHWVGCNGDWVAFVQQDGHLTIRNIYISDTIIPLPSLQDAGISLGPTSEWWHGSPPFLFKYKIDKSLELLKVRIVKRPYKDDLAGPWHYEVIVVFDELIAILQAPLEKEWNILRNPEFFDRNSYVDAMGIPGYGTHAAPRLIDAPVIEDEEAEVAAIFAQIEGDAVMEDDEANVAQGDGGADEDNDADEEELEEDEFDDEELDDEELDDDGDNHNYEDEDVFLGFSDQRTWFLAPMRAESITGESDLAWIQVKGYRPILGPPILHMGNKLRSYPLSTMVVHMREGQVVRYKVNAKADMVRNNMTLIRCPCRKCGLRQWIDPDSGQLEEHLLRRGFMLGFNEEPAANVGHEEEADIGREDEESPEHGVHHEEGEGDEGDDDAGGDGGGDAESKQTPLTSALRDPHVQELLLKDTGNAKPEAKLAQMEVDGMTPLYPGCRPEDTRLSVTLECLEMKAEHKWTDSSFSDNMKSWHARLPKDNTLPTSIDEAKKVVCPLDLPHVKYHACINDCALFRNEYKDRTTCPVCGQGRYKRGNKKVPLKVVWYFPITPRLQRYFVDPKEAKLMQWHAEREKPADDPEKGKILTHPADASQWNALDIEFADEFGSEPRNIRLGMSTDGLNPFGNQSSTHSTWPVFVWPYNLPPGCAQSSVQDYPGYAYVSCQVNHGFKGCVKCMDKTPHLQLPKPPGSCKTVFQGTRMWLRFDHPWRKRKDLFNGEEELGRAPRPRSGEEISELLENWEECPAPGKKRPRESPLLGVWKARSVFWDLPYWKVLHTPHSLDVMHITKNVTESLLGTLMNMPERTKDGPKARTDLKLLGLKKELQYPTDSDDDDEQTETTQGHHKRAKKNEVVVLKPACFTLSEEELERFFECLLGVKVPHGYSGKISRYLDVAKKRFSGMKSHDCHVLMTQILPVAMRGIMDDHVRETLFGLCNFFDVISRKSIGVKQLNRLQEEIVEILCELEIYFPPAFFDIMVHLLVHVVDDIIHLGPTFLHNMMPFERLNGVIKGFVRNRARPDGSIAKGFLTYECISFCQNYLSTENEDVGLPTRKHVGRLAGFGHREGYRAMHVGIAGRHADFDRAHRVALQHIELVSPWVDKHKSLIEQKFIDLGRPRKTGDVTKEHNSTFTGWFKKRLLESPAPMPSTEEQKLIFSLSQGPGHNVRTYQSYDINGYRFYTEEKDKNSEYQNSGVTMLSYTDDKTDVKERFYGRIEEIWELDYVGVTMPMFRVRWAKSVEKDGLYFTTMVIPDAKSKTPSAKNEPWVLASQVDQCFFITDPSKPSRVVVRRGKRSIIGMEGEADKQDIDKNGDPKIEEEFDKYFDKPTTYSKVRRKTTLPAKGCPYTRRNLKVAGLKYSTTAMKKGKNIVKKR